jgi:thiol:disulfide interchange protein
MKANMQAIIFRLWIVAGLIVVLGMHPSTAQHTQVTFLDLSWDQALKMAKEQQKVIFVDVYRDGIQEEPRQQMANEVFTQAEVASILNDQMISIRIDMSTDAGRAFAPKLQMNMFPLYGFYSSSGDLLKTARAGSVINQNEDFVMIAKESMQMNRERMQNTRSIIFLDQKWDELLAIAREQNKLIFVDCYAVWCQPCIQMERNVFTLNHVADFYNQNFLNVKIDIEKGEGLELRHTYGVSAVPNYLFVDGKGQIVHRFSGYTEADPFIKQGKIALEKAAE